ncbi:uncharacterized protein DNG_10170 [Cephalotrichum gorgonifer]|uniref:Cyclin-D1-binding protein 1-like N-terminal domain-containing protein n=1 Tax=Cephalotrichum gorgonifer TaxID=2041049 RepID=A0AAE8N746_9PEZI|nr:uncharacterized protein DNG_10170 [Cephalotrichum gorgonifer]
MAPQASDTAIQDLNTLVSNVVVLLTKLEATLTSLSKQTKTAATPSSSGTASDFDSLRVAHDSASLIKSHTTKLSLLIITEPFTPSAICTVLRELVSGPVPALAAAAETCDPARYTTDFSQALNSKCHFVLRDLRTFILKIPTDGKVLSDEAQRVSTDGSGKGSMAMTGLLWSICDDLMSFSQAGVSGYYIQKVEETRLTLKDIIEELKEWSEEEEDDDEDDDEPVHADFDSAVDVGDSRGNSPGPGGAAQAVLDDLMNSAGTIPRDDPDNIRGRVEICLRRLRLSMILCQAVTKRRLKAAPKFPAEDAGVVRTLERAIGSLKQLPDRFEDAAMAFYDLDPAGIDASMKVCAEEAVGVAKMLEKSWAGEKDEFTEWAEKFEVQITK